MTQLAQPLPAGGHRREEEALAEIEHTVVSPNTVRMLLAAFLLSLAALPVLELAMARRAPETGIGAAWSHLSGIPGEVRSQLAQRADAGWWQRLTTANRIALSGLSGFERALENDSFIGRKLRAPAQFAMTQWLGAGTEGVYVGRDGWLFYHPDLAYVSGRGFLDPVRLKQRARATDSLALPPQPDPRRAILQFREALASRGITLIVMPTPLKPGVHPDKLTGRQVESADVLQNASFDAFTADLARQGVLVVDPSEAMAAARAEGPQYLAHDTHWRPEAMELVAERLRDFIASNASLPRVDAPGYQVERVEVSNIGDVARLLDLPPGQRLHAPETVWLRRILQPDGSAWRPSRDADVLVLGDSFANIYTLESLGWGTSAGLVEQLSFAMRRPIDRIVQNDEGAFATRAMLMQDRDRLNGKRVVVYQFAARELATGDWKLNLGS
jgi:alginate O-acetyltransferase complex protein AlgJ